MQSNRYWAFDSFRCGLFRSPTHRRRFHFWVFYNTCCESIQRKQSVILSGIVRRRWCIVQRCSRIVKIPHVCCARRAFKNSPVRIAAAIFLVQVGSNQLHQSHQRINRHKPFRSHRRRAPSRPLIRVQKCRSRPLFLHQWRMFHALFHSENFILISDFLFFDHIG